MKNQTVLLVFILFATTLFGQTAGQTDQVILKFKHEPVNSNDRHITGNNKIDAVSAMHNALSVKKQALGRHSGQSIYVIRFPEETDIQRVIAAYTDTDELEYAEPDFIGSGGGVQGITPNDQYYFRQWGLHNTGTFTLSPGIAGADIDMENGWNIEQGDSNIVVAILDSGMKLDHPEFAGRIWVNSDEVPGNGLDDDANGFIDDTRGWDFANADNLPADDYGHGTNVGGIVGINGNNAAGYAGVDWHCKLMALKGLDNNNLGYYSWWSGALYYATDNGAKVVNMSMGGSSFSTTLQNAIDYAVNNGVVVVACMMNTNSGVTYYPAGFPGVIAVGSTNTDDTRTAPFFWSATSGSNYGNHISVVAPGNYIYGLNYQSNSNYNSYWGGTSQATPHVTGIVSLLLAQDPSRTPAQIKNILESTAEDQVGNPAEDTPGWDQYYGFGRVNAYNALSLLSGVTAPALRGWTLSVSPNPASGAFRISVSDGKPASCDIMNILGQSVLHRETTGMVTEITEKLTPGVYFVVVRRGNDVATEKIVVE